MPSLFGNRERDEREEMRAVAESVRPSLFRFADPLPHTCTQPDTKREASRYRERTQYSQQKQLSPAQHSEKGKKTETTREEKAFEKARRVDGEGVERREGKGGRRRNTTTTKRGTSRAQRSNHFSKPINRREQRQRSGEPTSSQKARHPLLRHLLQNTLALPLATARRRRWDRRCQRVPFCRSLSFSFFLFFFLLVLTTLKQENELVSFTIISGPLLSLLFYNKKTIYIRLKRKLRSFNTMVKYEEQTHTRKRAYGGKGRGREEVKDRRGTGEWGRKERKQVMWALVRVTSRFISMA